MKAEGYTRAIVPASCGLQTAAPTGGLSLILWVIGVLFLSGFIATISVDREPQLFGALVVVAVCLLPVAGAVLALSILASPLFGASLHTKVSGVRLGGIVAGLAVVSSPGFLQCFIDAVTLSQIASLTDRPHLALLSAAGVLAASVARCSVEVAIPLLAAFLVAELFWGFLQRVFDVTSSILDAVRVLVFTGIVCLWFGGCHSYVVAKAFEGVPLLLSAPGSQEGS